ncbi:MAG: TRAM domain-containing protein [Planctomycetota bacterium]
MIWGLRIAFALVLAMIGRSLTLRFWEHSDELASGGSAPWWWGSLAGLLFGSIFIMVEVAFTRRFVALLSTVVFGVVFGFIASYIFTTTLFLLPVFNEGEPWFKEWVQYCSLAIFVYFAVVGILQSKDDFKFVIPFVELKKEEKGPKPLLLDTSVIIDGRIADVMDMRLIASKIILPRFVLNELQQVADSQDRLKRNRGRRGLDVLNKIQNSKGAVIEIYEGTPPNAEGVDAKLVALAKFLDARVVTNDFNLNKIAQLQGVEVLNLNDLAVAMRPVILPGESLEVKVQKPGDSHGQGVGYLDDGTMVVIEGGYQRIGETVPISVTSVIQTSAGRMIFGQVKGQSQVPQPGSTPPVAAPPDPRGGRGVPRSSRPKTDIFPTPFAGGSSPEAPPTRPKSEVPVHESQNARGGRQGNGSRQAGGGRRPSDPANPGVSVPAPEARPPQRGSDLPAAGGKSSDSPAPGGKESDSPVAKEMGGGAKVS